MLEKWENIESERRRKSRDKVIGNGGRRMIVSLDRSAWIIQNGCKKGDEEGEFTYVGARGSTTIDYVIVNEETRINRGI